VVTGWGRHVFDSTCTTSTHWLTSVSYCAGMEAQHTRSALPTSILWGLDMIIALPVPSMASLRELVLRQVLIAVSNNLLELITCPCWKL
jgi:hypothetical protein